MVNLLTHTRLGTSTWLHLRLPTLEQTPRHPTTLHGHVCPKSGIAACALCALEDRAAAHQSVREPRDLPRAAALWGD
jgi:pyrroline-5-carboxylate reductase